MWFRLPSGTLVNLDKVSRIGIAERSGSSCPDKRAGAGYRVYAVDDTTDYTLYESDSLQDCREILLDFESALEAACIDRDDEGNDVLFTVGDDDPPLGGTFRLS